MTFGDRILRGRDCGADFIFSAGEQEFYAMKGLMNEPSRCAPCRSQRRAQREGGGATINAAGSGPHDRPGREMHPAVCAQCGQETMVPFMPRGDRPVYCRDRFEQVRSGRR